METYYVIAQGEPKSRGSGPSWTWDLGEFATEEAARAHPIARVPNLGPHRITLSWIKRDETGEVVGAEIVDTLAYFD